MNKVILVGRVTKDLIGTVTPNGISTCRFSIAVNRSFKNGDGEYEADFINIVTWRTTADNCVKYLRKGSRVGVVGRMQVTCSTTNNGEKRYFTDVVAEEVEFLQDKPSDVKAAPQSVSQTAPRTVNTLVPVVDDDLPF